MYILHIDTPESQPKSNYSDEQQLLSETALVVESLQVVRKSDNNYVT
jgi:hypothetical protein